MTLGVEIKKFFPTAACDTMNADTLYEKDFYGWIFHNINLLRQGKLAEINVELLMEELESMAKRDQYELISHLVILI